MTHRVVGNVIVTNNQPIKKLMYMAVCIGMLHGTSTSNKFDKELDYHANTSVVGNNCLIVNYDPRESQKSAKNMMLL